MSYSAKKSSGLGVNQLKMSEEAYDNGLTNCSSGHISGQTNWKNSSIHYIYKENGKKHKIKQYLID